MRSLRAISFRLVDDMRNRLRRRRRSDDLLEHAANNIPIGFVMFDARRRLVVVNDTFLELYGIPREAAPKGASLEDLLRTRFASFGISEEELSERVEAVVELVDCGRPHRRVDQLADGRFISVSHRPLDCGGWVGTHEDVTERQAVEEHLRYLAHHDSLTGLKNRAYFWSAMADAADAHRRFEQRFAVHLVDLDHFKDVNDRLGHNAGDAVLREAARRLQASARRLDVVARIGGDEFAVIQRDEKLAYSDAEALSRSIVAAMRERVTASNTAITLGVSVGVMFADDPSMDVAEIVERADRALYLAKARGRDQHVLFSHELTLADDRRRA